MTKKGKAILICWGVIQLGMFCTSEVYAWKKKAFILDGYQKDCMVLSEGEKLTCSECRELREGDEVTKKPNTGALKIQWAPYSEGQQINPTTIRILFKPPQDKGSILSKVGDFFSFIQKGVQIRHEPVPVVTRGGDSVMQPNNNATMMVGKKTLFVAEGEQPLKIAFANDRGEEIFSRSLPASLSIELTPEEIGLRPGDAYTWRIVGTKSSEPMKIRLLDAATAKQVTEDLEKAAEETVCRCDAERSIKQAAYLQLISDADPANIDLYWLSFRLIEGIARGKDGITGYGAAIANQLSKNYQEHLLQTTTN
jgi:hypothetical protein